MGMQSTEQPGLEVVTSGGLILHPKHNTDDLPIYAGNGTDAPIPVKMEQWPGPDANPPVVATPSHTICGLRRRTFWIVFLVAVVVVAAAVGGGVGGSLAKNGQSPEDTTEDANLLVTAPTTTSISSTPSTDTSTGTTSTSTTNTPTPSAAACPAINGTTITVKDTTYIQLCDTDLCSRSAGCTSVTISDKNLQKFTTDSLEECIEQCEVYNSVIKGDVCKGVSWDEYAPPGANRLRRCFLKNNTTVRKSAPSGWTVVSAVIEGK